jgi:hypothetical protein
MRSPLNVVGRPDFEAAAAALKGAQGLSMSDPSFMMAMSNGSRSGMNGVNINDLFNAQ